MAVDYIIRGGSRDHTIGEVKGMGKGGRERGKKREKKRARQERGMGEGGRERGRNRKRGREEERGREKSRKIRGGGSKGACEIARQKSERECEGRGEE